MGRLEVRDWVDVIHCHDGIQPFGYLVWAACGKDLGFSPEGILGHAARSSRYSADEVRELSFEGEPPDPAALSRKWRARLASAPEIVAILPPEELGRCVLARDGQLFRGTPSELRSALDQGAVIFHPGRIRGALPHLRPGRRTP